MIRPRFSCEGSGLGPPVLPVASPLPAIGGSLCGSLWCSDLVLRQWADPCQLAVRTNATYQGLAAHSRVLLREVISCRDKRFVSSSWRVSSPKTALHKWRRPGVSPYRGSFSCNSVVQQIPHVPSSFKKKGKPVTDVKKSWHPACEKAEVHNSLFHDLRRTAVTT